jgi:chemosensory pili system protein ChpA (sensor histidine kinase/response regulator)
MYTIPTILTVDDSQLIRKIVIRALRTYKCRVIEAEDGDIGLKAAADHRPDLIILDQNMPNMEGFEMLKHLRVHPKIKSTKVIMLTSNSTPEFVREAVALGVRDYIVKPFEDSKFVEKVLRQVQLARA